MITEPFLLGLHQNIHKALFICRGTWGGTCKGRHALLGGKIGILILLSFAGQRVQQNIPFSSKDKGNQAEAGTDLVKHGKSW